MYKKSDEEHDKHEVDEAGFEQVKQLESHGSHSLLTVFSTYLTGHLSGQEVPNKNYPAVQLMQESPSQAAVHASQVGWQGFNFKSI